MQSIKIFNGCEVLIDNSVTRVTVRHHEARRVMPNSYPSDGIFNLHRITIMDSFYCIIFLRQLHLDFNICCFINLRYNNYIFRSRKVRYGSSLICWRPNVWWKLTWKWCQVKMTSKSAYWRHARESSYTSHVRRHFLAPVGFTETPVGYARKRYLTKHHQVYWGDVSLAFGMDAPFERPQVTCTLGDESIPQGFWHRK